MKGEPAVSRTAQFDQFVDERGGALWRAAWLLTGDTHHAEDLVQTALTKTYPKFGGFDDSGSFEAYVRTTIYRTFVSWWRKRSWRSEIPTEIRPDVVHESGGDPALRTDLVRALATLPRKQRACLVLRYFEDHSTREVAELLGMAEGTVTSHVSRGLAALRASSFLSDEEDVR